MLDDVGRSTMMLEDVGDVGRWWMMMLEDVGR